MLVHDEIHETYVAERNLEPDTGGAPARYPSIETCFCRFSIRGQDRIEMGDHPAVFREASDTYDHPVLSEDR